MENCPVLCWIEGWHMVGFDSLQGDSVPVLILSVHKTRADLGILRIISAFAATGVSQNEEIPRKIASSTRVAKRQAYAAWVGPMS